MLDKEVTIVCRGDSWKECRFNTPELWGASTNLLVPILCDKLYTKVFAFDNDPVTMASIEVAKERAIPIVSKLDYATEIYPIREVVRFFLSSYFMPTISYMLAYALYYSYNYLNIYGIDQGANWHVLQGKSYVTFWLGVATGMKVKLRIGRGSCRWAYGNGTGGMPQAFLEQEKNTLYCNLGEESLKCAVVTK